jgi:Spy/CpxP family protein refolding chaperone
MKKTSILAALALTFTCPAWSEEPTPEQEQALAQFRTDMMADRAEIMAKGLKLDAQQAAKFWPLFETFQKEQGVLVDVQAKALKEYADHFKTLSDADATSYIDSLLERDQKMLELRKKWLKKFSDAVGPKAAAGAIQLDRRLTNVVEVQMSTRIPLIN